MKNVLLLNFNDFFLRSGLIKKQRRDSGLRSLITLVLIVSMTSCGSPNQKIQNPAAPAKLALSTGYTLLGSVRSGDGFTPLPSVTAQDALGHSIANYSASLTATAYTSSSCATSAAGTLVATGAPPSRSSADSFSGFSYSGAAGNIYIKFSSTPLSGSPITSSCLGPITIKAGAASQLVFTTQPSPTPTYSSGATFGGYTVQVQDAWGNLVTTPAVSISLALTGPVTATLNGGDAVLSSSGSATFSSLSVGKAGTYGLTASAPGLTGATSNSVVIKAGKAGAASQLVFTTQPSPTPTYSSGATFGGYTVQVQDAWGNVVTTPAVSISLALTGPVTATLNGGDAVLSSSGSTAFSSLSVGKAGTYQLTASAPGLTGATSNSVVIKAGAASQLVFTTQPSATPTYLSGATFGGYTVQVQDAWGNVVTTPAVSISLALTSAPNNRSVAATLNGGRAVLSSSGSATFSSLSWVNAGGTSAGNAGSSGSPIPTGSFAPSSSNSWSDKAGNIFIADFNGAVRVVAANNDSTPIAGIPPTQVASPVPSWTQGGIYTVAGALGQSLDQRLTSSDTIYYSLTASAPSLTSAVSNSFVIEGYPATQASFKFPFSTVIDSQGNLFISDNLDCTIWEVSASTGLIVRVAGTSGNCDNTGGDGVATQVDLSSPSALAVDSNDNLYIADKTNYAVRVLVRTTGSATIAGITQTWISGHLYTIAGRLGSGGSSTGDGAIAAAATFTNPMGLAVDGSGNLYIGDNYEVRVVANVSGSATIAGVYQTWAAGNIYTVAGNPSSGGAGDRVTAVGGAILAGNGPNQLALDSSGNLFISDTGNHAVRVVPNASVSSILGISGPYQAGYIYTIAGQVGVPGRSITANVPATDLAFFVIGGISFDPSGNLFIADDLNFRIMKVNASTGEIATFAGSSSITLFTFSGATGPIDDGGPATSAQLLFPCP